MNNNSTPSERIVITRRDHLELQPWQVTAPSTDELRVRVAYSAVSFGDVMLRRHVFRQRPTVAVPGYEIVGTIDAVGSGVTGMKPGDRVAAFTEYGGNARHALVRACDAVALPGAVDDVHAAAALLNYASALGMIESARLVKGDDFLIHGATGGMGSATLDTGRALGLSALGTTRGDSSVSLFGARLLDSRSKTLVNDVLSSSNGGVRAVFDSRAGSGLWKSHAMVRRGGSLIVFGLSSVAKPGLRAALGTVSSLASLGLFSVLPSKRTAIFAMDKIYRRDSARIRAWVTRIMNMLASGTIAPIVGGVLPLDQVAKAHHLVETGQIIGKVVIDCR